MTSEKKTTRTTDASSPRKSKTNTKGRSRMLLMEMPLVATACLIGWTAFVIYVATITEVMSQMEQDYLAELENATSTRDKLKSITSALLLHHSSRSRRRRENSGSHLEEPRKPPLSISEVTTFLHEWIAELHHRLIALPLRPGDSDHNAQLVWDVYHDHASKTLIPWDVDEYLPRMPIRRTDDSIFLSIATFRDENCMTTLADAFQMAYDPQRLFIGLNQQNCVQDCKTGVLEHGGIRPQLEPDPDCYQLFCTDHPQWCPQVRVLHVNESDSIGPYGARYMASKLYGGESWYMQMDAHMTFLQDWDQHAVEMMHAAPTAKPVVTHYPPGAKMNLTTQSRKPGGRLCGPVFTPNTISAIIRLEGLARWDDIRMDVPRFAPFIGAGFVLAHADLLQEVPFDPLLPYIFMGEEIIMSARLWTSGYDLYSPTHCVVGHMYVRPHKPKFWESVGRFTHAGDALEDKVLERIKYQLKYPESQKDMFRDWSVLSHLKHYGLGTERSLDDYMTSVGIDVTAKQIIRTGWCEEGRVPPGMEEYAYVYDTSNMTATPTYPPPPPPPTMPRAQRRRPRKQMHQ